METQSLGRWLMVTGAVIALVGVIVSIFGRLPWIGRLPGDIYVKNDRFTFYFPVVTCVIVSLILNICVRFIRRR